ncbi:retrotransposon ty1-copia subclass, partial [Chrysochromulina tobinii]
LASATAISCASCAEARIKQAAHRGTLSTPAPEAGVLHVDLKEMVISAEGYRYFMVAVDEFTRYLFIAFLKYKSEAGGQLLAIVNKFNATVGTPVDSDGHALPRPRVRTIHSDHEGKLISHSFRAARNAEGLHHTLSPPNDHDLNPIAERVIRTIAESSSAIRIASNASARHWPHIVAYAADWHNALVGSVGSSSSDSNITPHQRFTLRPPRVMDLATFGCRAFALKPPQHQHKSSLAGRGIEGAFFGRSLDSKGCYDVLVGTGATAKIVRSSSVRRPDAHTFEIPISAWRTVPKVPFGKSVGEHALSLEIALDDVDLKSPDDVIDGIRASFLTALRADSPDAPATHAEAVKRGDVWMRAEGKEMANHETNKSWTFVRRADVPAGRRIHRLIWVYKVKRDGTCKARLCVQGSTLEAGVDYDQVFSAALRYSSARSLFAFAAKTGCRVRSIDLIAAYLQGEFLDGEVVYCHAAQGYAKYDKNGEPMIARVDKP